MKHKIDLGNSRPVRQRPRSTPKAFAFEDDKIIEEQLKSGVISESSSLWANHLVYVRKKMVTSDHALTTESSMHLVKVMHTP